MKLPACRLRDPFLATLSVLAVVPSIALAADDGSCVPVPTPPSIQVKVPVSDPSEPTPIIVDLQGGVGSDLGALPEVTLPDAPDAAGTVVSDGGSLVIRAVSPSLVVSNPTDPGGADSIVAPTPAPVETTATLTLDPAASWGVDPFGNPCLLVSITDVQPGGGLLPAGSVVAVVGTGFQLEAQVQIDGVEIASASWVDSTRIEVVTAVDAQLDGSSITVLNPDGTGATYIASVPTTDLAVSASQMLAATAAIFPAQARSSAVFTPPTSGTFFALALQNLDPADSIVSIDFWDGGSVVASASLALASGTRVSRAISELFPGVVPGAESFFQVTATVPVQMLGLAGNETDGSVAPVLPTLASP